MHIHKGLQNSSEVHNPRWSIWLLDEYNIIAEEYNEFIEPRAHSGPYV